MKVTEIAFVCYAVDDLPVARKFYEEVFKLTPSNVWESEDKKMGVIEYEIGPHTFSIGCGAPEFKSGVEGPTVALEVENFDAAIAELRAAGAPVVTEPQETGVCWMALVKDPSGNQLMVHRRKQG